MVNVNEYKAQKYFAYMLSIASIEIIRNEKS
jgi:hypothetical protein